MSFNQSMTTFSNAKLNRQGGWNLSNATNVGEFSVAAFETSPQGIFIRQNDGKKLYLGANSGNGIDEFDMSTGWDITTMSHNQFVSASALPAGVSWKPDGTIFYELDGSGDQVVESSASTAWDISTLTFTSNFSVAGQDTNPVGIYWSVNGLNMFIVGNQNTDAYKYTVSPAWDSSAAVFSQSVDLSSEFSNIGRGIYFKPDGSRMFVVGKNGSSEETVQAYDLSTIFDLTTVVAAESINIDADAVQAHGLSFRDLDGLKMYVSSFADNKIIEYDL